MTDAIEKAVFPYLGKYVYTNIFSIEKKEFVAFFVFIKMKNNYELWTYDSREDFKMKIYDIDKQEGNS